MTPVDAGRSLPFPRAPSSTRRGSLALRVTLLLGGGLLAVGWLLRNPDTANRALLTGSLTGAVRSVQRDLREESLDRQEESFRQALQEGRLQQARADLQELRQLDPEEDYSYLARELEGAPSLESRDDLERLLTAVRDDRSSLLEEPRSSGRFLGGYGPRNHYLSLRFQLAQTYRNLGEEAHSLGVLEQLAQDLEEAGRSPRPTEEIRTLRKLGSALVFRYDQWGYPARAEALWGRLPRLAPGEGPYEGF